MENAGTSTGGEAGAAAPGGLATLNEPGRKRLSSRFIAIYAALAIVLVASVAAFVYFALRPSIAPSAAWSSWRPSAGRTAAVAKQIADHVAPTYHLANGAQLVAVVPSTPAVTAGTENVSINAVAVHSARTGNTDVTELAPGNTEMFTLCGLGQRCSIATGKPSLRRGELVRREALETALYTFKYLPAINSVIVFMPPRKDLPNQRTVLFFQREGLSSRLKMPLDQTLPLAKPPSPNVQSTIEDGTIDALTLPVLYNSNLTQLQAGGALLVLTPVEV
jgi:hypothetical protein